ncbi:MAG: bacillithiol biosynthesis BshC [Gemmatimonadaceae bacterium]|nr:bacillithiol biosynthesis BshC [Gemmatimonadaceae bacterium]
MSDVEALVETLKQEGLQIRTVPLGGSALSRALQTGLAGRDWLTPRPVGAAAWRAHAERVRAGFAGDAWYQSLAPAISATGAAAVRLQRAIASGVVVTTGQQPGLFGGPTYTFSKALGALAFADALEAASGIPVAPIFWAASDDADWMEAAVTHVATARGLLTAQLAGPATDGVAMAEVPLGDLSEARAVLDQALGSVPHRSIVDLVDSAYVPHATVGGAYVQLLRALLEPLGIAVLDASHAAVREAADPHLRRALKQSAAAHEALVARVQAIEAAGHAPQVDVVDGLSLVFHTQTASVDGQVRRVRERVPIADAAQVAREATAGSLGANVLLRPVIERAILPTVCYMAGPGELAYFAQVGPIATALGLAEPVVAPRWAGALVEDQVLRLQEHLCISDEDLMDPHAAEQMVARGRVDAEVADTLERLRITMDAQLRTLQDAMRGDSAPVADQVVEGLSRDLTHRLDRFERRVLAGVKRRESEVMREVAVVRAALRPAGQPSERVLNLIPILARYGVRVLPAMREAAAPHAAELLGIT